MGGFVDVYLPSAIPGYPCYSSPRFSTTITVVAGGDEGRNQNWRHPLRHFKLPAAEARGFGVIADLIDMSLVLAGPANAFAWRDPLDFASIRLLGPNEPQASIAARISGADQRFGTGDGVTRAFQLSKGYVYQGHAYVRPIGLPLVSTLVIENAGAPTTAWSVTRPGGVVTFDVAPAAGHALTWGGLFDVPVRFDADDGLDTLIAAFGAGGAAEINLDETRLC